jgi:GDSL-like Lipase/Acylhydrolase
MIKNIKMLLLVSLTFVACTTKEEEVVVDNNSSDNLPLTAGTADFSKYVALGNSLTAGFSDGALFIEGQKGSWTNILAQQFKLVGGGDFKIPFMADNVGGFAGSTTYTPRLYLAPPTTPGGSPSPSSVALPPYNQLSTTTTTPLVGPFNNMGVPGAKSFHLGIPGYGQLNPYFGRFASAPGATVIGDAVAQSPTFFSLWIGNNDVLSYATSGGTGTNQITNTNPLTYGLDDITNPQVFAASYSALLSDQTGLRKNGAKGVVSNIPYVTSIPFFTTVPINPLTLDQTTVGQLNAGYAQYNGGLAAAVQFGIITEAEKVARTINFKALGTDGKPFSNPVVIVDDYLTPITLGPNVLPNYRQTTSDDLIVLSSQGTAVNKPFFLAGNGSAIPLADRFVLSKNEISELKTATDAFNTTIKSLASQYNLAFVDANKVLSDVANFGITGNGYTLNSTYVTGGAFSLDGVHPSPRGYALIANEFIKAINAKYGSNLKGVNFADYRIMFPATLN